MAMSSSMRRRSGLTDEGIGCSDIGTSSRAEGRSFMLGARPGPAQPLTAVYECAQPRPKHPSRGAGSGMGAGQTYRYTEPYTVAALILLAATLISAMLVRRMERRFKPKSRVPTAHR